MPAPGTPINLTVVAFIWPAGSHGPCPLAMPSLDNVCLERLPSSVPDCQPAVRRGIFPPSLLHVWDSLGIEEAQF